MAQRDPATGRFVKSRPAPEDRVAGWALYALAAVAVVVVLILVAAVRHAG